MSNAQTVDIVRSAQERQYTKFEEQAREMLMQKIGQNPEMQKFQERLSDIKEAFEKKDDKKDNDEDNDGEDKDDDDEDGDDDSDNDDSNDDDSDEDEED